MTKRHLELPPAAQDRLDRAVGNVDERLSSVDDTAAVVAEVIAELFGDGALYARYRSGESLPPLTEARLASYDPANAFVESERWAEQDLETLRRSKAIGYLWRAFDRSPLAENVAFALPFRQMLANHLFAEAGDGLRLFSGIKIQCGHNIVMGDNVVVHNDVLLDDRGELIIGDRVSIADDAHVHTHGHDVVDQTDVTTYRTELGDDVRLGYGAMVNAAAPPRACGSSPAGSRSRASQDRSPTTARAARSSRRSPRTSSPSTSSAGTSCRQTSSPRPPPPPPMRPEPKEAGR